MLDTQQTIVAIASPRSPAVRGIVRLSGEQVGEVLQRLGVAVAGGARPRRCETQIDLGRPLGAIPAGVLHWPTRHSYTGQPSAELHTVGSRPVLAALVDAAIAAGARAARPGEFTLRAFLAGRRDLTQAEAVLGVIEAEQRGSLDHALRQLAGNLSRPLEHARGEMLDLLADVEAGLDFVDEDIEFISEEALVARLAQIARVLEETHQTLRTRGGESGRPVIALRGEPNAGKSHLINRLAGRDVAIVADVAGTTRDAVSADAQLGGRPVRLVDTAGIETGDAEISQRAQTQATLADRQAALRLWCVDSSRDDFDAACQRARQVSRSAPDAAPSAQHAGLDVWVATKSDLRRQALPEGWLATSAVTGEGIEALNQRILQRLDSRDLGETASVAGTAARCRQTLRRAIEATGAAIELAQLGEGQELVATELRTAIESLGEITGAVYTEDILDRVFGRFCIGK